MYGDPLKMSGDKWYCRLSENHMKNRHVYSTVRCEPLKVIKSHSYTNCYYNCAVDASSKFKNHQSSSHSLKATDNM